MSTSSLHHSAVADRAQRLWEEAGRPAGRDLEFWLQAEGQVQALAPRLAQSGARTASRRGTLEKAPSQRSRRS